MLWRAIIISTTFVAFPLERAAWAETPADEEAAVAAIRGVASNIQMNRDGTVRFVRFSKNRVTDDHLAHVAAFKQVDYLAVVTPTVTEAGIAHVAGLTNLDTLYLSGSGITDAGLYAVKDLAKLERLYLDNTSVGDGGLDHLAGLESLKVLALARTDVTDAGLKHLSDLASLEELDLSDTAIGDVGLAHLAELTPLTTLRLAGTRITGSGLANLGNAANLTTLDLCRTEVSSDAIASLAVHKKLQRLLLYETNVSRESLTELTKALPKLGVYLSPPEGQERSALERFLARPHKPASSREESDSDVDGLAQHGVLQPANERFLASDETPDFQRHVIPLLGRLGCNGRSCHGSFQGQGGFRLSMFGYDFAADLEALTGGEEPRIDRDSPSDSLILYKPTSEDEHGGGKRFEPGGWEQELLARWIEGGAAGVQDDAPKLVRLDVSPAEVVFTAPDQTAQLKVVAVWSDGAREDVTCLTRFRTNDDTAAEVTPDGLIRSIRPGDTYVISFYDNGVFSTEVVLPVSEQTQEQYPRVPTPTRIDALVVAKLAKLGVVPSDLCSDEAFLRRASLDIAGTLPTPGEVRAFLADSSPDKRERKIDELLQRPAYVEWWTNLLCDLTGSNAQFLGTTDMNQTAAGQWRAWIRRCVKDNIGWDRIAAGILLATSRKPGQTYDDYAAEQSSYVRSDEPADFTAPGNPMHYYWFRNNLQQPSDRALSFGYVFLGVRLECAQCHKHPFDAWSKDDFERFTEFFTRIKSGVAPDAAEAQRQLKIRLGVPDKLDTAALRRQMYMRVAAEGRPIPWNEVYIEPPPKNPLQDPQPARLLGGETIDLADHADPREPLVAWLTSPDNPYFARAFVNRVWAHYFGLGIVDPPDDFNQANPPSNKPLLDYLAAEFVRHGYDLRWLHRTIANSRTYQLSWRPNETNRSDERNFSRARLRRLPAEVTIDAILQATASDGAQEKLAANVTARKIAQHPKSIQARGIDYSLLVFGKPLRTTNCDCERQSQPTLLQSLYVRNDHEVLGWLERPDGWLRQVADELGQRLAPEVGVPKTAPKQHDGESSTAESPEPDRIVQLLQEAYLRTLSRHPDDGEMAEAQHHVANATTAVEGLRDLMWALLNTKEFGTNH